MRKSLASLLVVGLLGGLLFVALTNVALAHDDANEKAKSSIDMVYKQRKGKFVGHVSSGRDLCLGGRKVVLFKARNDARVGSTTTNDNGGWSLAANKDSGRYYSKVTSETYVTDEGVDEYGELLWEHTLTCGAAKSDTVGT